MCPICRNRINPNMNTDLAKVYYNIIKGRGRCPFCGWELTMYAVGATAMEFYERIEPDDIHDKFVFLPRVEIGIAASIPMSPEQIFSSYKKRWGIETLYQYIIKNKGDFNDLKIQDYYKEQGMSFVMLITGQIHQKMIAGVNSPDDNTISVHDIMLMARCMKMERRGNSWNLRNTRKRDLEILKKLGFTQPLLLMTDGFILVKA